MAFAKTILVCAILVAAGLALLMRLRRRQLRRRERRARWEAELRRDLRDLGQ